MTLAITGGKSLAAVEADAQTGITNAATAQATANAAGSLASAAIPLTQKAAASGVASLNASSKVVQEPATLFGQTPGAVADGEFLKRVGATIVGAAVSAGLLPNYVEGLGLEYIDTVLFRVLAGRVRDAGDTVDLVLASDKIVDMAQPPTGGNGGIDRKALTGTGALAAGVVTGTGTAFLTEFGTRLLTGEFYVFEEVDEFNTPSSDFRKEVKIGDLVGNASLGFVRVVNIENGVLHLAEDFPNTGSPDYDSEDPVTLYIIENPTIQIGSKTAFVVSIASNTSLKVGSNQTVGAGATLYAGVSLTEQSSTYFSTLHGITFYPSPYYAVWLIGTEIYASTQRTTPFFAGAKRKIGWITGTMPWEINGNSKIGYIAPFTQTGKGVTRQIHYRMGGGQAMAFVSGLPTGSPGSFNMNLSGGGFTTTSGGGLSDRYGYGVPPEAKLAFLRANIGAGNGNGAYAALSFAAAGDFANIGVNTWHTLFVQLDPGNYYPDASAQAQGAVPMDRCQRVAVRVQGTMDDMSPTVSVLGYEYDI